ncbi:MAG: hypothetical protein ACREPI_08720, partial [Candidatus Dormibacterales bacterium]
RREFVEQSVARLRSQVAGAEAGLEEARAAHAQAALEAERASRRSAELVRLRAELDGLDALRPEGDAGGRRVGDVLIALPGWEAALSAVLGPLVDAFAVAGEEEATLLAGPDLPQRTVVFPAPAPERRPGSLLDHVRAEPGYEALAARLLGPVVVGAAPPPSVTSEGVYREPGLVRSGVDPRVALAARRRRVLDRIREVEPGAGREEELAQQARAAGRRLEGLLADLAARDRLQAEVDDLAAARDAEGRLGSGLPRLEAEAAEAEREAAALGAALTEGARQLAEHSSETRRLETERARLRERGEDLARRSSAVEADLQRLAETGAARGARAREALAAAEGARSEIPRLEAAVVTADAALAAAEVRSPGEDAELADSARKLVALEEARVDARLRLGTLEAGLGLATRDEELASARMEELRARLPEGRAPEEVPGGRAREREMRSLERRLEEIGPTNDLAARELDELEERHRTLGEQLADIAAARQDLDGLVARLRSEEEARYEAVFGAVAANFQELFTRLSGGGEATLRHVAGEEGPRSGVEIMTQPPRKRLVRNVQLLSTGERALVALALVLALEEVNPSPFVILDEVDAALDDANVGRFTGLLAELGASRQFLVVTHNHQTMSAASALYGIHLDESGSSHLVSVRLEDVHAGSRPGAGVQAAS